MTSIYDEVKLRGRRQIQRFRIDIILGGMEEDDAESLMAALADQDIPSMRISEALAERGWAISANAVANYRRAKVR